MLRHRCTIRAGRIHPADEPAFRRELARMDGKTVSVTVKVWREAMTTPQLRYWWAVPVAILAEHCGYEREEMHAALKYKFLRTTDAHGLEVVPSIRALDTAAMSRLIDEVRRWALVDLGVDVPAPNEVELEEPVYN